MILPLLLSLAHAAEVPEDLSTPPELADADGWVQLSSGEWLYGELLRMRNRDFSFDSDKMNKQVVDWKDVDVIYVSRSMEWMLEDRSELVGPGVLTGDTLQVRTADGVVSVPRGEVAGIVPGGRRELSHWGLHMDAAFGGWWGNTDQLTLNGFNRLYREDAVRIWNLGYEFALARNDGEATVNRHRLFSNFNLFINGGFFIIPYAADAYHDPFQNIRIRTTLGSGVGWRDFASNDFEYFANGSVLYQYLDPFGNEDNSDPHGFGTQFEGGYIWDITGDVTWELSWATTVIWTRLGDTSHRGRMVWDIDITDAFSVFAAATYWRVEEPRTNPDGTTPRSDDVEVAMGFALDL